MQNRSLGRLVEFPFYNGGSVSELRFIPAQQSPRKRMAWAGGWPCGENQRE